MSDDSKGILSTLWDKRNMSVDEFLKEVERRPDLAFLLTSAGIWFAVRWFLGIWIGAHVIYFVYRIFTLVLG